MRKVIALLAGMALALLSACGQQDPLLQGSLQSLRSIGQPRSNGPDAAAIRRTLTPQRLAQIGEPVILAELPARGAAAGLIRSGQNGEVTTYLTPDGISMSLERGMLVATRGLGFDLMSADVEEPLMALAGAAPDAQAVRVHAYLDGEGQIFNRGFICTYSDSNQPRIETCHSTDLTIENHYWQDGRGEIIRSRQWVGPQIGYARIETMAGGKQ